MMQYHHYYTIFNLLLKICLRLSIFNYKFWETAVAQSIEKDPGILFIYPKQHQITCGQTLRILFKIQNFIIPQDGYLHVTANKIDYLIEENWDSFVMQNVEPGTYILNLQFLGTNYEPTGRSHFLHFEHVLTDQEILSSRYSPTSIEFAPKRIVNLGHQQNHMLQNVCYVSSSSQFDGQKKLWLQVMDYMIKNNKSVHVLSFVHSFTSEFGLKLRQLNVSKTESPLHISTEIGKEYFVTVKNVTDYLVNAFDISSNHNRKNMDIITMMEPTWAKEVWMQVIDAIKSASCDVLSFGNSRSSGDILLTRASSLAGVKVIIMELPNHFPANVSVSAIIAPSYFSAKLTSMASSISYNSTYVVNPGINLSVYQPIKLPKKKSKVVGYVGRLDSGKSIGLLLHSINIVLKRITDLRVVIIGEGPMRPYLEDLAIRFGISQHVKFKGPIYQGLPKQLAEMDVFVTTSMAETFCIANIEAMAMGIPIVTFGIGGMSEYVQHKVNSLVVDRAHPQAIAESIETLLLNNDIAQAYGSASRKLIERKFDLDRGMDSYLRIYQRLFEA